MPTTACVRSGLHDRYVLLIMSRFGIALLFGDKTIGESAATAGSIPGRS